MFCNGLDLRDENCVRIITNLFVSIPGIVDAFFILPITILFLKIWIGRLEGPLGTYAEGNIPMTYFGIADEIKE